MFKSCYAFMNCCTYLIEGISISGGDVLLIDAIGDDVAVKEFLNRARQVDYIGP